MQKVKHPMLHLVNSKFSFSGNLLPILALNHWYEYDIYGAFKHLVWTVSLCESVMQAVLDHGLIFNPFRGTPLMRHIDVDGKPPGLF